MNPTPKQRFQESGDSVTKHRKMVDSVEFTKASDVALLQYMSGLAGEIASAEDAARSTVAMNAGFKLLGAHQFTHVLRNLSETPSEPKIIPVPALNHKL